jgi:hypothetical protein
MTLRITLDSVYEVDITITVHCTLGEERVEFLAEKDIPAHYMGNGAKGSGGAAGSGGSSAETGSVAAPPPARPSASAAAAPPAGPYSHSETEFASKSEPT